MPTWSLVHPVRKHNAPGKGVAPVTVNASNKKEAAEKIFKTISKSIYTEGLDGFKEIKFKFSIVRHLDYIDDLKDYDLSDWVNYEGVRKKHANNKIKISVFEFDNEDIKGGASKFKIKVPKKANANNSQSGGYIPLYPWEWYGYPFLSDKKKNNDLEYIWDYWPLYYNYMPTALPFPGLSVYPYMYPYVYNPLLEPILSEE